MSKKNIFSIIISNILFFIIFFATRFYIAKNEFIQNNIKSLSFVVFIVLIATSNIMIYKYQKLCKSFVIYIACVLVLQLSIYTSSTKVSLKGIILEVVAMVICMGVIKFFDNKKLSGFLDKISIIAIYIVFCIADIHQNIYIIAVLSILVILKYYYLLKEDKLLEHNNFDVIIALMFFSIINFEFSIWFLYVYNFKVSVMEKIEIEFEL